MANLPPIGSAHRVCIICEGYEEEAYIKRLCELSVWSKVYSFIPINAKGASNIPARFEDAFYNNKYEIVLIFCDTDKAPYREYSFTKSKINKFLGKQKADEKLIIYANPCSMQIILLHFGEVVLRNQGKKTNADVIETYTGVKDYDAHQDQIDALLRCVYKRTYSQMRKRVSKINNQDTVSGSSNIIRFIEYFESDNTKWIKEINTYLNRE